MVIESDITQALSILSRGGLVAFPTETVYGLGADAANPAALQRVFAAKQRPLDHPLIVHIADILQLKDWAREVSHPAMQLAEAFWPGPLTLILKKAPLVSDWVTGGQDTIGLRIPSHPIAQALLDRWGGGLAAPSANRFGCISPTTAGAVREELGNVVDMVLDGGQCEVGVESTIIDVSGEQPVVLRPGMITVQQIEAVLQTSVKRGKKESPRVSGALESHYAPRTPTLLITSREVTNFLATVEEKNLPLALLSYSQLIVQHRGVEFVKMPNDPIQYAHDLYRLLREMDNKNVKYIVIEAVPEASAWDAIRDRLQKASKKEGSISSPFEKGG